jgi:glycogen debranching enzyme
MDGDGYVEYRCNEPLAGLINHGWKDSPVAVFNTDGSVAEQPIALVEIQAYVWAAKRGMAELYEMRGDAGRARELREQAEVLRQRFNQDFWMPDRDFFALALDGQKRQVQPITSNPGHALWTGIIEPRLAERMNARFKRADMLSGWGVRTVADSEVGYNPMGYQIGSVWPHDVSLLVGGLRRYGFDRDALTIATQLYSAGREFLYLRFPELFTGIARSHNPFPVPWPVACSPQAWAAGTTLFLLQTFLGIYPDAGGQKVTLSPSLPPWLEEVRISNLRIGEGTLDLRFMSHGEYSTVQVLSRVGPLEVMI